MASATSDFGPTLHRPDILLKIMQVEPEQMYLLAAARAAARRRPEAIQFRDWLMTLAARG